MIQELLVFAIFFAVIAYGIYNTFFKKKKMEGGSGCAKCSSNPANQ
ncbi:FeoB-associated Cys-rich membrane protein [Nafulsella turpanensis]|nr:FeoB-associated Cys-rich membrane protein [Nafulsella turpanensis]